MQVSSNIKKHLKITKSVVIADRFFTIFVLLIVGWEYPGGLLAIHQFMNNNQSMKDHTIILRISGIT